MKSDHVKKMICFTGYLLIASLCLVIFTNCSVDPYISQKNLSSQNDTYSKFETHSHAAWSPSDGGNFNQKVVRDPSSPVITNFSWDQVTILRSETTYVHHDFRDWPETAKIKNYSIRGEHPNKGICVSHTRETQWYEPFMGPDFKNGGKVEWRNIGSLWIIIPLKDGTIYATTSHHLHTPSHMDWHCVMGWKNEDVRGVMDNIGSHARKTGWLKDPTTIAGFAPIKNWNPEPGQILGIVITPCVELKHRHHRSEKSDLIWVRMPDPSAVTVSSDIVGRHSDSSGNTNPSGPLGQCDVPNHKHIVQQVANDYPDLLAKANNKQNKNWEFLEKTVEELRKIDTKWGFYHRTQHNLQEASLDAVAYYCGAGNGNGNSDLRFVDVISSSLNVQWSDEGHEDRARPENGYWKYPRLGDTGTGGGNTTDQQVGQCSPQPNHCIAGVPHPHPKDTLTEYRWTCRNVPHSTGEIRCKAPRTTDNCGPAPHYVAVNGRCLPSCGALAHAKGVGKTDHQLQPAPTCRTGWTRLGDSKEQAQHGRSVCCKRSSSSSTSTTTTQGRTSTSGFDPSTFSWNKVHFINGGVIVSQNISGWSETSRITSFSMSSKGICIDHTMKNTWSTIKQPGHRDKPSETQGSPWIFIPRSNGKIYAKIYEHLRPASDPAMRGRGGQVCKLGHKQNTLAGVISKLVDHVKAIHLTGKPQRDAIAPIQDWHPQPGDILGFAVSTYGANPRDYRSGSRNERSDIVWVRVPDYNAVDSGKEIIARTSGGVTTPTN